MQIIFRILSIIIYPAIVTAVFITLIKIPSANPIHYYLLWSLVLFTIINWISWKAVWGIISILVILVLTIYTSMLTEDSGYLLLNIPTLILILLLYLNEEHTKTSATSLKLKLDRQERDYNLLLHDYKKQEGLRDSYNKKVKRFSHLSQIAKDLGFSLAPDEIHRRIINDLTKTIDGGDVYLLWEVGKDLQTLALKALESPEGILSPESIRSDEFNQWTMRHRQPLLITNVTKDYRFNTAEILSKTSTKSLIMAPLMTGDKIMGIIRIDSSRPDAFSLDDLRLMAIIANIATLTIHNAKLFKETEYLAIRDGLTGLYVKRCFQENLESTLTESKRKGNSFSVLLLDLDKFKLLNDTYGHSIGDKVLKRMAELIEEGAGPNAVSARYGGEEFVVLLPSTTKQQALPIAEKIRNQIETEPFSARREEIAATISIGVSTFPDDGDTPDGLLDKSDKALYRAKHKGRNRVVAA